MNSIIYQITGLIALLIFLTVSTLIYLANRQMEDLFRNYLINHPVYHGVMRVPEQHFITSVHETLIWVGGAILIIGVIISYIMALKITVPLRKLANAAKEIEKGNLKQLLPVEAKDEVGQLTIAFNSMTKALSTNNQLRRRLLADIAHELKTPLAVIQGHLEGMLEGVIDLSQEQIASLYQETTHLNRLITDLRDLSLAEARQLTLNKSIVNINDLINRALQMLSPLAEDKEIEFHSSLQPIPEIAVDISRFNQILYNLLTNAIHYSPNKKSITISTEIVMDKGSKLIKIDIQDQGAGIDPKDLPFIFHHFYKTDLSRDRKQSGTGIGLAIVKQLVEIHGGFVKVESELNQGSTFSVYFPIS